jgi:hypothetical protein
VVAQHDPLSSADGGLPAPVAGFKTRYDAPDYLLDLPFGVATVTLIAKPQAADLEQIGHVIVQWYFEIFQMRGKTQPKLLRPSEVAEANCVAQTLDPISEQINASFGIAGHTRSHG